MQDDSYPIKLYFGLSKFGAFLTFIGPSVGVSPDITISYCSCRTLARKDFSDCFDRIQLTIVEH